MNKRTYLLVLLSILFLTGTQGCKAQSKNEETSTSPWELSTPLKEGISTDVIESIHQDIENGKYGLIDHFLLIRNGKIVADHSYEQDYEKVMQKYDTTNHQYNYDHTAWHPFYQKTKLHSLQSVTKSITSILFGIAMDKGLIDSVGQRAMPYFGHYNPDLSDARKDTMTIHDLLTMRSGIEWDEQNYDNANNSCVLMEGSEDWIQFVLDHPMATPPGTVFEYNSGASVLLGKIVREATGMRIDKWAEKVLFGPLGIKDYYWKFTPKGEVDTEGGLYLSSHDLARIGYLMLHFGMWDNKRIVSEAWVRASINPEVQFNETSGYGYQWWVPAFKGTRTEIFAGNGFGGQFLMVVPKKDLVLVFNGWNIHDDTEMSSWKALQDRILPAAW
jgi:CubicO group peptidase (beta-lactamase class C family)